MLKQRPYLGRTSTAEHQLAGTRQAYEDFTYLVVQDLKTPLRRIAGFSQLLEEKYRPVLDERGLYYIDLIAESSRKLQEHLAGLLQYSKLDTTPLRLEKTDCNRLLYQCRKQLHREIEEREAKIDVQALPEVMADTDRLCLLFYCLLGNALKFCAGQPVIHMSARRSYDTWIFSVKDNGIGIAPHDHETIFTLFHQLHKKGEYPGIGLGLAMARRIAEMHGGMIWVESKLGKGAEFYVTLPDLPSGG